MSARRSQVLYGVSCALLLLTFFLWWFARSTAEKPDHGPGLALRPNVAMPHIQAPVHMIMYPTPIRAGAAQPRHPGPLADLPAVIEAWDATMIAKGDLSQFFTADEMDRRRDRPDLPIVLPPGAEKPRTMSRLFRKEMRARIRGETYACVGGDLLFEGGEPTPHMVECLVWRPNGWQLTNDLTGCRLASVFAGLVPTTSASSTTPYLADLAERPWPSSIALMVDDILTCQSSTYPWVAQIGLNRLAVPRSIPALISYMANPHISDEQRDIAIKACLLMDSQVAFAALKKAGENAPWRRQAAALMTHKSWRSDWIPTLRPLIDNGEDDLWFGCFSGALITTASKEVNLWLDDRALSGTASHIQREMLPIMFERYPGYISEDRLIAHVGQFVGDDLTAKALAMLACQPDKPVEKTLDALASAGLSQRGIQPIVENVAHRLAIQWNEPMLIDQVAQRLMLPHPEDRWLAAEVLARLGEKHRKLIVTLETAISREQEPTLKERLVTLVTNLSKLPPQTTP